MRRRRISRQTRVLRFPIERARKAALGCSRTDEAAFNELWSAIAPALVATVNRITRYEPEQVQLLEEAARRLRELGPSQFDARSTGDVHYLWEVLRRDMMRVAWERKVWLPLRSRLA